MNKKKIFISKSDYLPESNRTRNENLILTKSKQVKDVKFKFQGKIFKSSTSTYRNFRKISRSLYEYKSKIFDRIFDYL